MINKQVAVDEALHVKHPAGVWCIHMHAAMSWLVHQGYISLSVSGSVLTIRVEQGVRGMKQGGQRKLIVPPELVRNAACHDTLWCQLYVNGIAASSWQTLKCHALCRSYNLQLQQS